MKDLGVQKKELVPKASILEGVFAITIVFIINLLTAKLRNLFFYLR